LELKPDTAKERISRSRQIYSIVENFEWPVIAKKILGPDAR
jgi:hypothetical protein